jgi:hypothetical protein
MIPTSMTTRQRIVTGLVPKKWAASMEAESRQWMVRCPCGHEVSVWDLGGIRWKAVGNKMRLRRCSVCGSVEWHTVYKSTA